MHHTHSSERQPTSTTSGYGAHGEGGRSSSAMRILSILGGGWLALEGLRRRDPLGVGLVVLGTCLVMGAEQSRALLSRIVGTAPGPGGTRATAWSERASEFGQRVASTWSGPIRIEESITIDRPREEVYRFFRDFNNLPRFMNHVETITVLSDVRSHWVLEAPAGTKVEWDSIIESEQENERIAWRSAEGADITNSGTVTFKDAAGGGTEVRVELTYEAPMGRLGQMLARLLGEEPQVQAQDDLRRLKEIMESGAAGAKGGAGWTPVGGGNGDQWPMRH
jgi:uncharacterized membrane protein